MSDACKPCLEGTTFYSNGICVTCGRKLKSTVETDAEKVAANLRYMEATGDLRPLWWTLKTIIKLEWRKWRG